MRTEARHSVVLIAGTGVTAGLGLAYSVYVGRVLGPAAFADYAATLSLVFICSVATGLINPTVARFAAEYEGRGEHGRIRTLAREIGWRVGMFGAAGAVVALLASPPLAGFLQFHSYRPLLIGCAIVYLNLLLSVARGILRGVQHFGQLSLNGIIEAAGRLVIGVALLRIAANASMGLAAYAIAIAAALAASPWQMRPAWQGQQAQRLDDGAAIRRFTVPILLMMVAAAGFEHMDVLVAKRVLREADAGTYAAAAALARVVSVLVTPFTTMMLPMLAALHERGHATLRPFVRVCSYFLLLAAGPLLVVCLWPERVMVLLYGSDYGGAGTVLTCLAGARLAGYLAHMVCLLYAARSRFGFLYVYVLGLGVMVAGLGVWHDTPEMTAAVVLAAHGVTLVAMVVHLWVNQEHLR